MNMQKTTFTKKRDFDTTLPIETLTEEFKAVASENFELQKRQITK